MGLKKRPSLLSKSPMIGITMDIEEGYFKLKRHYVDAVLKAGGVPVVMPPLSERAIDRIDGFLLPGGDDLHPSYYNEPKRFDMKLLSREKTDFEINLIREIIKLKKPLLGICYGMQVINVSLGGSLYQDIQSQLPDAINHREEHEIIVKRGWLLKPGTYTVGSTHHQAVKTLGKGLEVLANSKDGLIEAFYMKDYPFLLGVQWHPERCSKAISSGIFSLFIKAAYAFK
ncbi:MAG: gamma-glutamyl-gamma-aminobutyrate hydrolase family protein [Nitrospirae bacterium]|nr:gamma-glutamyl-gamma-aminobutyrate hydrolase family protein [Nitrospirota bacterium]